ncbi:MAG: sugar transferase [Saprospiraceae bacterium]|nr:sugar transferase [Saprospiraceae bacterium]
MKLLRNPLHENPAASTVRADALPFPIDASARKRLTSTTPDELPIGYYLSKRFLDVLLAATITLFVLSWLLPLLILINALMGNYPVFFVQRRVGFEHRIFNCYKLRTIPMNPKKRIGRWSTFLRNNKLDELPQFINVLKGDMSIVGPRPHMLSDHRNFSKALGRQYFGRLKVLPGITGLAQVKGYEGRVTSLEKLQGRIRCDLTYINEWSLWLDLRIMARTLLILVKRPK